MEPKLSSPQRQENAVPLSLYAIAYQWMHLLRVFHDAAEGRSDGGWPAPHTDAFGVALPKMPTPRSSLATVPRTLLTVAARLTTSARYVHVWLDAAAHAAWQRLFERLTKRLARVTRRVTAPSALANAPP